MISKLSDPTYTIYNLTSAINTKDMPLVEKILSGNKQLIRKKDKVFYFPLKNISYNKFCIIYRMAILLLYMLPCMVILSVWRI